MDRKTNYIIIDHFTSRTEEERKQMVLNLVIKYINERIDAENSENKIIKYENLS